MSAAEIDAYIAAQDPQTRATLEEMRSRILEVIPDADQGLSYGMPVFKVNKKAIAAFAVFKNHLSYLPHSGSVLGALDDELSAYSCTKSSLHFAFDKPLPKKLVRRLITVRLQEAGVGPRP